MKRLILILFILFIVLDNLNAQVLREWAKLYNGPGNNSQDFGYTVKTDSEGNIVVSGTQGLANFLTLKYSQTGSLLWNRIHLNYGLGGCYENAIDSDNNIYSAGTESYDTTFPLWSYTIIKYDPFGNEKWTSKVYIQSSQVGQLYDIETYNNYTIFTGGTPSMGTECMMLDSNGILLWRKTFPYGTTDNGFLNLHGSSIFLTFSSNLVYLTKIALEGDIQWIVKYSGQNIFPFGSLSDSNGNIYNGLYATGDSSKMIILKYNQANGNLLWSKVYPGGIGYKKMLISNSNKILVGHSALNNISRYAVSKIDLNGNLLWQAETNDNIPGGLNSICLDENESVFATGWTPTGCRTVKFSNNGLLLWSDIYNLNAETTVGFDIAAKNGIVYVSGYGIQDGCDAITIKYSQPLNIQPISNEIPKQFSLSQNYPNPFNPTTNFEFSIPQTEFVNLTIYDAMGRVVETLHNGELKPGTYEAEWNASNFPSGVYFYKLSANSFIETKKMILIK